MAKQALIVFVKAPIPGNVKTRLTPDLSFEQAAEIYSAFIKDSFQIYKQLDNTDLFYFYYPENHLNLLQDLLPEQKNWVYQQDGDLGDKMYFAFQEILNRYKKAVIVGSDHPDLSITFLKKAFNVLDYVDISIGPSDDGGYYCIGMKKANFSIFENMTWSVATVYEETLKRIEKAKLEVFELPEWYDVDTIADLKRFAKSANRSNFPEISKYLKANPLL